MIAAIVYWNSTYLADAVQHLRDQGKSVPHALLTHTSPLTWEHIGFSGDFLWDHAPATAGHRRSLNPGAGQGSNMIDVPGPFALSVVCMTTDVMPSITLGGLPVLVSDAQVTPTAFRHGRLRQVDHANDTSLVLTALVTSTPGYSAHQAPGRLHRCNRLHPAKTFP